MIHINFHIHYVTNFGTRLQMVLHLKNGTTQLLAMYYANQGNWQAELIKEDRDQCLQYHYELVDDSAVLSKEWGKLCHQIKINKGNENYYVVDAWQEMPVNKNFLSSPFTQHFFAHAAQKEKPLQSDSLLTLQLCAPDLLPHQAVAIVGEADVLGCWEPQRALPLTVSSFPLWEITLDFTSLPQHTAYKFIIIDTVTSQLVRWEEGENRMLDIPLIISHTHLIYTSLYFRGSFYWRTAGVAIPIFSLRSNNSGGIGEFSDLKLLVDWAAASHQTIIQTLPINDTTITHTWKDSYPYNSISIFALHPLYLSVKQMGNLRNTQEMAQVLQQLAHLNALSQVDYEAVDLVKWSYFRKIYQQEGAKTRQMVAYKKFYDKNIEWLQPYAVFSFLRDKYHTADPAQWEILRSYNAQTVADYFDVANPDYESVSFYVYLQYHLDKQLGEARRYASSKGIVLKGDIPIGISRKSVEAWKDPCFFNLDTQAGAPPDDFSLMGQNWGFPTYNWAAMAQDGYAWWRKRFAKMADYFDIYRIDHILGFFRIWQIPTHAVQGLLGQFSPALPFSLEELSQWGLPMQAERYLQPYIHESMLTKFLGESCQDLESYLISLDNGYYMLKPSCDTQQKIVALYNDAQGNMSEQLRDGLLGFCNEVLFVADSELPHHYHPRIAAQYTYSYAHLTLYKKERFNAIYNEFFYHRHNDFWAQKAMQKLPHLLDSNQMMACAEDLGMIPNCVPQVLKNLQVMTLEIERMPKDPYLTFGLTGCYAYNTVCTTSTHDMSNLRLWWTENSEITQKYYNEVLMQGGEAPREATPEICRMIVTNHLLSPAMLAILPLQDWLSIDAALRSQDIMDERINVPANPHHYWRYRMHLTLEELIAHKDFSQHLATLIGETRG